LSIANYRAETNGFDVAILDVHDILNANFRTYTHPVDPDDDYNSFPTEEQIRECIKRVYDGSHANHMYDGKLGYVLLVGYSFFNHNSTLDYDYTDPSGMPSSQSLYPGLYQLSTNPPIRNKSHCFNDYYFSCVTKDPLGDFDFWGDLAIGRFSVNSHDELSNIVDKTIYYETEATFTKKQNNLLVRSECPLDPNGNLYFDDKYVPYFTNLLSGQSSLYNVNTVRPDENDLPQWKVSITDNINNGCGLIYHYGHGDKDLWSQYQVASSGDLTLDYLNNNLTNTGLTSFAYVNNCYSGYYIRPAGSNIVGCLSEELTKMADKGFIGYVGWSNYSPFPVNPALLDPDPTNPAMPFSPIFTNEWFAFYILHDQEHVAGKALWGAKLSQTGTQQSLFQENLMGDPALDLFSEGYQLTHQVVLNCPTSISDKIKIKNGGSLIIPPNCTLYFEQGGQLIVESGGKLIIGDGARIYGKDESNLIYIEGDLWGTSSPLPPYSNNPLNQVTLTSLTGTSWSGIEFNNSPANIEFNDCSFNNCDIFGSLGSISFSNCSLSYSHLNFSSTNFDFESNSQTQQENATFLLENYTNNIYHSYISGCNIINNHSYPFSNSVIRIIGYRNIVIYNNTINYTNTTGIDLINSGGSGDYIGLVENNTIQRIGDPQEYSFGILCYFSWIQVLNNHIFNCDYGLTGLDYSALNVSGIESANNVAGTQQITDNFDAQVYTEGYSFPYLIHFNQFKNDNWPNNPLIVDMDPLLPPTKLNVECNCFPSSFTLEPSGFYDWTPTWCPKATCTSSKILVDMINNGYELCYAKKTKEAKNLFLNVINEASDPVSIIDAAKPLFGLERLTTNNFNELIKFLTINPKFNDRPQLRSFANHLINKCNVEAKNYTSAISTYESSIMKPDNLADSVFSIIDLSSTYFKLKNDSSAFNQDYVGNFPTYKLISPIQFRTQFDTLIKLLFKHNKNITSSNNIEIANKVEQFFLFQNYPNPAFDFTEISYYVPYSCNIKISITDILGEAIKTFNTGTNDSGTHSVKINTKELTSGVYSYSFYVNDKLIDSKKMVIVKN